MLIDILLFFITSALYMGMRMKFLCVMAIIYIKIISVMYDKWLKKNPVFDKIEGKVKKYT